MAGLDTITARILEEARQRAETVLGEARAEAEQLRARSRTQTEKECREKKERGDARVQELLERGRSAAELEKRRRILAYKQQLLHEVMEEAYSLLLRLEQEEYFRLVEKMAVKAAEPGEGVLYFSGKDLERMPRDYEKRLNAALGDGASVRISREARDIEGGFILAYGGIEENRTFRALFEADREAMQDLASRILFS